jgi:hypothetical protein
MMRKKKVGCVTVILFSNANCLTKISKLLIEDCLVGEALATQAILKSQNVPVRGKHHERHGTVGIRRASSRRAVENVAIKRYIKLGVVDARKVAAARRLHILRLQRKRVRVNVRARSDFVR